MLDFLTWKWHVEGYRSKFEAACINVLESMLDRHVHVPHRLTCITDDAKGISASVRVIPLADIPRAAEFLKIPNPSNRRNPCCYPRLYTYSADARRTIGERIVQLDADMVLVDDCTAMFDRREDFVIWGGQTVQPGSPQIYNWFNGSCSYLRAGTRTQVWDRFDPATSPQLAHNANCRGSDQGWISYVLGPREAVWSTADGIYSYNNHIVPNRGKLPAGARLVVFHGRHDPWHHDIQATHSWVRKHYR